MDHDNPKNVDFQIREHGGVNIEVEGNNPIKDYHDDEEDHDDQDDHNDQDDDDDIDVDLDIPLLEKAQKQLFLLT